MAVGVLGLATPASASSMSLAVTGSVQCTHGRPVEGVWVNSGSGGSGWAGLLKGHDATVKYFRYPPAHGTFSTAFNSAISVHVGCGLTGKKYASDNWTKAYDADGSGHMILNAYSCQSPKLVAGQTVRGSCALPPKGIFRVIVQPLRDRRRRKGYCTCGAAYMWFKNTGHYPTWVGNASDWYAHARAGLDRLLLSGGARPHHVARRIGVRGNHVGYVTSINVITVKLTFIDMNGGRHVDPQEKTELMASTLRDPAQCPRRHARVTCWVRCPTSHGRSSSWPIQDTTGPGAPPRFRRCRPTARCSPAPIRPAVVGRIGSVCE